MNEWVPVVYRSDGAWIGIMPDGEIGVGVKDEGRVSLKASKFVPMWAFMEQGLVECLAKFRENWRLLEGGGVSTPERLIELTVESAWNFGRSYWATLAASWVIKMAESGYFDTKLIRSLSASMVQSDAVDRSLKYQLQAILGT